MFVAVDDHITMPPLLSRLKAATKSLVVDAVRLPRCAQPPALGAVSASFGCLYGVEGVTLGGQHISRHLSHQFGDSPQHGAAFFNGYQQRTAEMWKSFRSAFAAHVDDAKAPLAEAAAIATFSGLRPWCCQDGPR